MLSAQELRLELSQFTGTTQYYKHFLGFRYTDGISFLARQAQCYWLLDAIGSYQQKLSKDPSLSEVQLWMLVVENGHEFIKPRPGKKAVLTCWKDKPVEGTRSAICQQIDYTDFPLPQIQLYFENKVLLLPSER